MDLEIRYENGSMTVHLEEFLSERRIAKVRKLLKVIRSSFTPECEQQMKEFIQEQTEQFEQVQKEHSIYIEGYTQKVKYAEQQIMQTNEELRNLKNLLWQRQKAFDGNVRNKEFYKKVMQEIT